MNVSAKILSVAHVQLAMPKDNEDRPLVVEGLDEMLARCEAAKLTTKADAEIDGRRRVHVFDPFGNRLELIEAKGA